MLKGKNEDSVILAISRMGVHCYCKSNFTPKMPKKLKILRGAKMLKILILKFLVFTNIVFVLI